MSNEITIVVKGDNRSQAALKEPQTELDKLRAKAKATGVDLDGLSNEFAAVSEHAETFGKKLEGSGSFTEFLDTKIRKLHADTTQLAQDFNRTGNTDLLGKMFDSQGAERALQKLRTGLDDALGRAGKDVEKALTDGGKEGSKQVSASMQGALSTPELGPVLVAALVGAALLAAPAVGGALASAAALGGIAGIVVGQFNDPHVHQAITSIGTDVMSTLTRSTKGFVEPLVAAAGTLKTALTGATASLDWGAVAKDIQPLATGIAGLVTNLLPGLNHMIESAGPIIAGLSQDFSTLGTEVSTAFDLIARGGKGEQETIRLVVLALGAMVIVIGAVVLGLSKMTEWFIAAEQAIGHFFERVDTGVHTLDEFVHAAARTFEKVAGNINGANDSGQEFIKTLGGMKAIGPDMDQLSAAIDKVTNSLDTNEAKLAGKLFGEMMNLDDATLHWHESLTKLSDTLKQNGLAIDWHTHRIQDSTKAGEENRAAILAAVQANMQQYQAMVAGGISATDAAKAYDQNTAALEKQLHAAGYTAAQIDDLIGKYRGIPDKVDTALAVSGLTEAINNLGALEAEIHGLDGRQFGFTVTETLTQRGQQLMQEGQAHGGIVGAAATGGVRAGLTMVGEYGRELVRLPAGSQVYPNGTTENMLAGAAGGGQGGGATTVEFRGDLDSGIAQLFMKLQRNGQIKIYSSAVVANR